MGIGNNIYVIIQEELSWVVLAILVGIGVYFLAKREFSKALVLGIVGVVACLLVFNAVAVKDFLLGIGNQMMGVAS